MCNVFLSKEKLNVLEGKVVYGVSTYSVEGLNLTVRSPPGEKYTYSNSKTK